MSFVFFIFPSSKFRGGMFQVLREAPPEKVAAHIRRLEALLAESDRQIDDLRRTTKAMTESFEGMKEDGERQVAVLLDEIASLGGAPVVIKKEEDRARDRKRAHSPFSVKREPE